MGLEGPYYGVYAELGYYDCVWVNNIDTAELYFELFSPDKEVLLVILIIDQAPTSSVA